MKHSGSVLPYRVFLHSGRKLDESGITEFPETKKSRMGLQSFGWSLEISGYLLKARVITAEDLCLHTASGSPWSRRSMAPGTPLSSITNRHPTFSWEWAVLEHDLGQVTAPLCKSSWKCIQNTETSVKTKQCIWAELPQITRKKFSSTEVNTCWAVVTSCGWSIFFNFQKLLKLIS